MGATEVLIHPAESARVYRHTLDALSRAYDVRFVSESVTGQTSALLLLDPTAEPPPGFWEQVFVVAEGQPTRSPSSEISFTDDRYLDRRLRARVVHDASTAGSSILQIGPGDVVLARRGIEPVWVRRDGGDGAALDVVSIPPPQLSETESMRLYFRADRFLGLLPLVHFLRSLQPSPWRPPPLRACVMVDDPNLHRTRYGQLDFERLSSSARELRYHAAIATIPLDAWFVGDGAKRVFNDNRKHLSLCVHGNNHTYAELAKPVTVEKAVQVLSQALRRMDRLEEKLGSDGSNILVAPHGLFGESMMRAASDVGFDAGQLDPTMYLDSDAAWRTPLMGWEPAVFGAGRFPLLPRFPIGSAPAESLIAAYLDQPVIVAGHHDDSLASFEKAVEWINSLGEVRWMSPGDLALSNYAVRADGDTLRLRMYSRRVRVDIPVDVTQLEVEYGGQPDGEWERREVVLAGESRSPLNGQRTKPIAVDTGTIEVAVRPNPGVNYRQVANPPITPWPILRRVLTETRDRLRLPRRQ